MSNIFQERDESKLVNERNVKPVKGKPQPKGQPSPPAPPQPAKPEPQQEGATTEQPVEGNTPLQPIAEQSGFYQAPIPFAPPIGYEPVQSSPFAFQQQTEILNGLQQAEQTNSLDPIIPTMERDTIVNPAVNSIRESLGNPLEKAEQWSDQWTQQTKSSWDKYVTHTNVGMNPATQFDPSGKPIKHATEQEIKTGLNGLMSDLGQSLQSNFDKGNWFSNNVRGMKGLVPMVKSVLESIPGAAASIPGVDLVSGALTNIFSGDEKFIEQHQAQIDAQKKLFYSNVRGDMNAAGEARKVLQANPISQSYNDYGDGTMGTIFRTISLPENLVMAGVYEYADGWRQFQDNREDRTFLGNAQAALAAAAGTLAVTEPENDKTKNRFISVLQGRDLSAFNRYSSDRYLTLQEPKGVEVGQRTGNWWWDLPENITKTWGLDDTTPTGYMTTAMLGNVLQGVPSFVASVVSDAPIDALATAIFKYGKLANKVDIIGKADDALVSVKQAVPSVGQQPGNNLILPASDRSAAAHIVPRLDVPEVPQPAFPVVADPWEFTPNPNKAATHMIQLDAPTPELIPTVDLDFVYRSNDDLARLANRTGIEVEPTEAAIGELMRNDPDRFARYGKPVHPELEYFNTIQTPQGAVPIEPTFPVADRPLPDTTGEDFLEKFNNSGAGMQAAEEVIQDAFSQGNVPPESAIVKYEKAQSQHIISRDSMPPELAYKENVNNLPPDLYINKPEALNDGTDYIIGLQDAEASNQVAKQLINNYSELDTVDQLIDTKLSALPNVGLEDMHDVQAVMGQNGMDDLMDAPIAKDVPEPKDLIDTITNDPTISGLETEVNQLTEAWDVQKETLHKRLVREYKKEGLDPLDVFDDPEFVTAQARHSYQMDTLVYKQLKQQQELLGSIPPTSKSTFLAGAEQQIKEYGDALPPDLKASWQSMFDDISGVGKKEVSPVQPTLNLIQTKMDEVTAKRDKLTFSDREGKERLDVAKDWLERLQDHVSTRPSLAKGMAPDIDNAVNNLDVAAMERFWTPLNNAPVEQSFIINQQITRTPKAGDMQMAGGAEQMEAWRRGNEMMWFHGTNVADDVRRFIPENGSGTHELGMGLYLTTDQQVAEASAKKFRYENTPVNMNYQVGEPTVRELDMSNIRQVVDYDEVITKRKFTELFGDALNNSHERSEVQEFFHYWTANSDRTIGSVFDSYREWLADLSGGVDELANREFQRGVLRTMQAHYDAGVKGQTMVVFNPERLTNKGVLPVVSQAADPTLEALESRRFLDSVAAEQMGTDTRKVVKYQSQGDLLLYQKQKVSEQLAKELAQNADATKRITVADENLRRTVRDSKDAKVEAVQRRIETGKAEPKMLSEADGVQRLMETNKDFQKFRGRMEQQLQKKIDRLSKMSPNADNKAKRALMSEIEDLTNQIDSVDTAVNHYERVFNSMTPENIGKDWKDTLGTVLHNVQAHVLDENWWQNRGAYTWNKSFERTMSGIEHFIARYVSNYMGGDAGKIQQELYNLKRVGKGQFQFLMAQREAGQRVAQVQRTIKKMLKPYNLGDEDFARLFHDVAELQTSPYLVDDMKNANVNIYHYLSNKLNTEYARYIDMGIPKEVLDKVAEQVQIIPHVYSEVKSLADELGITFGDEITLGYVPRQKKRTTEFWLDRGHKGEQVGADFMKSRKAFHWVPEDSQVVDVVLNAVNPKWKQELGEALSKDIKHFDDLIGDDGAVLSTLVGQLDDETLDMLNSMGVMRKIPFTASESAKFLADKYQLPFNGLTDIYVSDPKRAIEMYSKGLADKASKNMMTFGLTEMSGFTHNINVMDDAEKAVFTVPFMDALPDSLKATLPGDFEELAKNLMVHPKVAGELKAMYHVSTNAGVLAQVGDVMNLIYKAGSSMMLSSGRWFAYQEIGNAANLVKRNMNPAPFFTFQAERLRSLANDGVMKFDNTKKIYGGGKMTQQDVYQLAVRSGLIESGDTFLGTSAKRPTVAVKDMPKEMKRSSAEFLQFMFQSGAHGKVDRTAGQVLTGMSERILSGAQTALDHTTMRYVEFGNKLTDDAFKFGLLESVLRDPGSRLSIPGWRALGGVEHFTSIDQAVKYVRDNSYMFDEASGGGEAAMRYLMPFWSFHRLNMGETARWVASNPAKFGSYLRLVNSLQSGFNEQDSAAWESIQSNKWFDNQFSVPLRIPGDRSQSGEDEIWVIPSAQVFPTFGALTSVNSIGTIMKTFGAGGFKIPFDVEGGYEKPSLSERNEFANSGSAIQREGSPFLKQILSFVDENYLFDYDMSSGYDLDKNYALGMDKKQYAIFKLWLRPMANLLNAMPTRVMGKAPELGRQSGNYDEGVKSVFTGQLPNWTSANVPNFFGEGVFQDFMKNIGLQPMPFNMYISQEYSMNNINYQVSQAESMMYKVRKELAETAPGDTKKIERLTQRAQETSLLYVHLQSEYEIYRQWRKLNNIPHPKAVKRILNANLQVSDLLPKAERERIYKENYDKYMGFFSY